WDMHRRVAGENSAIFRSFDALFHPDRTPDGGEPRFPQLFSAFLSTAQRVDTNDPTIGFSLDLRVLVPQYEIDGILFFKNHYEGGYLFRDKINFVATMPATPDKPWQLQYGFDSQSPNMATT